LAKAVEKRHRAQRNDNERQAVQARQKCHDLMRSVNGYAKMKPAIEAAKQKVVAACTDASGVHRKIIPDFLLAQVLDYANLELEAYRLGLAESGEFKNNSKMYWENVHRFITIQRSFGMDFPSPEAVRDVVMPLANCLRRVVRQPHRPEDKDQARLIQGIERMSLSGKEDNKSLEDLVGAVNEFLRQAPTEFFGNASADNQVTNGLEGGSAATASKDSDVDMEAA
jgi:hypothetical protein